MLDSSWFTDRTLLSIARQAGVTGAISRQMMVNARRHILIFAREIMKDAVAYAESLHSVSLCFTDVDAALARINARVYGFHDVSEGAVPRNDYDELYDFKFNQAIVASVMATADVTDAELAGTDGVAAALVSGGGGSSSSSSSSSGADAVVGADGDGDGDGDDGGLIIPRDLVTLLMIETMQACPKADLQVREQAICLFHHALEGHLRASFAWREGLPFPALCVAVGTLPLAVRTAAPYKQTVRRRNGGHNSSSGTKRKAPDGGGGSDVVSAKRGKREGNIQHGGLDAYKAVCTKFVELQQRNHRRRRRRFEPPCRAPAQIARSTQAGGGLCQNWHGGRGLRVADDSSSDTGSKIF